MLIINQTNYCNIIYQKSETERSVVNNLVVLIDGYLDRERLNRAKCEINDIITTVSTLEIKRELTLVISSDGGDMGPCIDFVNWLKKDAINNFSNVVAKIYTASSGAALIALTTTIRTISTYGVFGLHIGSIKVEASDVDANGVLDKRLAKLLKESRKKIFQLLDKAGISLSPEILSRLDAAGQFIFSPEECVETGICSKIF